MQENGYIIIDRQGRAQLSTLRSSRRECWLSFLPATAQALLSENPVLGRAQLERMRETRKRIGFRCVPVVVTPA